ncbi:aldo/keto reductase [Nigerium massiliense]|uniref:aldo/keto reductase n=1 Tax=Nigerium massiliense TaxID=1522317 RepID=UPI00059144E5|nr:aldo/keto reductase [Nigerium massiliense]
MTTDASKVPTITLNNGATIPQVGFGVFQVPVDETQKAVEQALEAGYRHIDTATGYENEDGVGRAIAQSGIPRDQLFITTKLPNQFQGRDKVRPAFMDSLNKLGVDQLDLYLMHWPCPGKGLTLETYEVFEDLAREGLTRAIGVSNFLPHHLEKLLANTEIVPAVNQIEIHPSYQQREAAEATRKAGIAVEAYSPLGQAQDLESDEVTKIAEAHGVSTGQVVLRWHLQNGIIVIPKSVKPERMASNIDLFGFELSDEEVAQIDGLEAGNRIGQDPNTFDKDQHAAK